MPDDKVDDKPRSHHRQEPGHAPEHAPRHAAEAPEEVGVVPVRTEPENLSPESRARDPEMVAKMRAELDAELGPLPKRPDMTVEEAQAVIRAHQFADVRENDRLQQAIARGSDKLASEPPDTTASTRA